MLNVKRKTDLPKELINLKAIRSVEHRTALIDLVYDLTEASKGLSRVAPEKSLADMIERFYVYLYDSVSSVTKINRRAKWMVSYGRLILGMMTAHNNCNMVFSEEATNPFHEDMLGQIDLMIEAIQACVSNGADEVITNSYMVLTALDNIVTATRRFKPNRTQQFYTAVETHVTGIRDFCKSRSDPKTGKFVFDHSRQLSDMLNRLLRVITKFA